MGSCQKLPIEKLKERGITTYEISKTEKLKGNNGYQGNYLIYRSKRETSNTSKAILATHFGLSLYNKSTGLTFVIPWKLGFSTVEQFEFRCNILTVILRRNGLVPEVDIIEYDLNTQKVIREIHGELPCECGQECHWIIFNKNKLALFTNLKSNIGLQHSTVYEYCWASNKTRMITKVEPYGIDAATGRNLNLKGVKFNLDNDKFEYEL